MVPTIPWILQRDDVGAVGGGKGAQTRGAGAEVLVGAVDVHTDGSGVRGSERGRAHDEHRHAAARKERRGREGPAAHRKGRAAAARHPHERARAHGTRPPPPRRVQMLLRPRGRRSRPVPASRKDTLPRIRVKSFFFVHLRLLHLFFALLLFVL